jgi:diguanylate cyclase (GGDEF)-like protein
MSIRLTSTALSNARNICNMFDIPGINVHRVALRVIKDSNLLKTGNYTAFAKKIDRLVPDIPNSKQPGTRKRLSVENISRVLGESETLVSRDGVTGKYKLRVKGILNDEEIDTLGRSEELTRKLATITAIEDVWKDLDSFINDNGIASGLSVYVRSDIQGAVRNYKNVYKEGMEKGSSYVNGKELTGEKAWLVYMLDLLVDRYSKENDPPTKIACKNLSKKMRVWPVTDRTKWRLIGIDRELIKKVLEDKAAGLDRILTTTILGISLNKKRNEIAKNMIAMIKEKCVLTEKEILKNGNKVLEAYLIKKGIESEVERDEAILAYEAVCEDIKKILPEIIMAIKNDQTRLTASKAAIEKNYGRDLEGKTLNMMINGADSIDTFSQIVQFYCEAQEDIEGDKVRLGIKKPGVPLWMGNLYFAILDNNFRPSTICLTNNNGLYLKSKIEEPLFGGNDAKRVSVVESLSKTCDTLSLVLSAKMADIEKKRDDEQKNKIIELSNTLNNVTIDLKERLKTAVTVIQKLFKKGDETVNATIHLVNPYNPKQIAIAATTKIDVTTGKPFIDEVDFEGEIKKITGWVANTKKEVSALRGKIYVGAEQRELTSVELDLIGETYPVLHGKLVDVCAKPDQSFMSIPFTITKEDGTEEIIGTMNIDGAGDQTKRDMERLISIKKELSSTIHNALLSEQVKQLTLTDELTGLPNRRAFDENILPNEFKHAEMSDQPLSAVSMDFVDFKRFNNGVQLQDKFIKGDHPTGDWAMKIFADLMEQFKVKKSKEDLKYQLVTNARRGKQADEFSILLPNTTIAEAEKYVQGLYDFMGESPIFFKDGSFASAPESVRIPRFRAGIAEYKKTGSSCPGIHSYQELMYVADMNERIVKEGFPEPICTPLKRKRG